MSRTERSNTIGYLTGYIINGVKVIAKIRLYNDNTWTLHVMGKTCDLSFLNVDEKYNFTSIFQLIRSLIYCNGTTAVHESKVGSDFITENVSKVHDENSYYTRYKSRSCFQVLPFKGSQNFKSSCKNYLYLEKPDAKSETPKTENPTELPESEELPVSQKDMPKTKDRPESDCLKLSVKDNSNLTIILNKVFPECGDNMRVFLQSQKMALERNPHGRRWPKDIIRLCLTLWCRSPKGYSDLRDSKFLILSSEKQLQRFKAGVNKESLHWMANEAKLKSIPPEGYHGGLIIDEMAIQPDLQFRRINGEIELIGFTEICPEALVLEKMKSNKFERTLATHGLQFVFLGYNGFRFPFAHFPSHNASGHELYLLLWKSVNMLSNFGFHIEYVSTDGAQSNRDLFKLLLPDFKSVNPTTCSFNNIYKFGGEQISFIMDISPVSKKIRNNILKSGTDQSSKRHLQMKNLYIEWRHFREAYSWDISSHPFPIHHKLTQEHLYLTSETKMRNYLAEDVLNGEMLHLMQNYKVSLKEKGGKLNATIDLLEKTSTLIQNFRDNRPITYDGDDRLKQNREAMDFFVTWEKEIKENDNIKNKEHCLISHQTRQDIVSSILGFEELCKQHFRKSNGSIIPSRVNSDVIENIFCQQRTLHNGANTNPTYLGYCYSLNSVILGQSVISRKSNTGGNAAKPSEGKLKRSSSHVGNF